MSDVIGLSWKSCTPYAAGLNLVAQIIVLSMLLAGACFVRASKLKTHSRLMKSAVIIRLDGSDCPRKPDQTLSGFS